MDGPAAFAHMLNVGFDVLAVSLNGATQAIETQIGDSTNEVVDHDRAEWWQHTGFASMPAGPTQGGASCQGIAIKHSDRDMVFASRDLRGTSIYGNLKSGETCVYASTGQARALFKQDGSARQMTTDDNTPTGNTVFAGVSPVWQSPSGPQLGGEWRHYAPWGGEWQDPSGYHLRTWHGVKIDAGGIVLPSPISLSGSTYTLTADIVKLDAALLVLGRDTGLASGAVQATQLQAVLSTLAGALTALETFFGTAGAALTTGGAGGSLGSLSTGETTAGGALTGAATSLSAAIAALGTITTACQSRTSIA